MKVGNLGLVHKTRLKGDHQSLTFGVMQLVDMMQSGGATTISKTTNFSPQILGQKYCLHWLHCKALIRALGTKNTNESVSVLVKWPLKIS